MSSKKAAKKGKNGKCNEKEQNAYQKYHQNTLNDKEFNIPELSRAQIFIGKKFLNGKQSTNWRIDHKPYPTVALFVQGYIGIYGNVNLINFFKSYSIDSNDEFMLHGKSNWCNSVISVPDDKIIQYKTMVRKIYIYFRNNDASKKKDENIDVDNGIDSDVGVDSGEQKDNETDTDQFSASVAVMPTPQPKQISSRRKYHQEGEYHQEGDYFILFNSYCKFCANHQIFF
eukprot:320697_1